MKARKLGNWIMNWIKSLLVSALLTLTFATLGAAQDGPSPEATAAGEAATAGAIDALLTEKAIGAAQSALDSRR